MYLGVRATSSKSSATRYRFAPRSRHTNDNAPHHEQHGNPGEEPSKRRAARANDFHLGCQQENIAGDRDPCREARPLSPTRAVEREKVERPETEERKAAGRKRADPGMIQRGIFRDVGPENHRGHQEAGDDAHPKDNTGDARR
jgi:hypothetical protein